MKKIDTDVLIVGAGPVGLFAVFQLGQLGMRCCVVDSLEEVGGQCSALYPEKPIYDIPAYPDIKAGDLITALMRQIKPFSPKFILNQKVEKLKQVSNSYNVTTSDQTEICSKCILIAAGNGAFGPNKPPLKDIEQFEDKSIFYSVRDKNMFKGKKIAIAGGGDSAVDWAIELSKITSKIFFIHRRAKLRASPANVKKLYDLEKKGKLEMVIPYQLDSIEGLDGFIKTLSLRNLDGETRELNTEFFLPFFGLSSELGPIKEWELDIQSNLINVEQSTCMTSKEGIYAIGDICNYPGKLKLILTGFSEAAIASHSCHKRIFPDKVLHFEYSTTKGINKDFT